MITGDYTERPRIAKSGKRVTDKVVTSTTGVEYAIGGNLGAGGVAKVFRALRLRDKKECVFKEYVPSPEKRRMHAAIKRNIQTLMGKPLTENDGVTPLRSFVGPMDKDSLILLPKSGGFGYIMEMVETKLFLPVPKLRHLDTYPDADVLCRAGINIARLFRKIHFRGWCYKDINEGNIYINNKTGDIRIIDCDNISVQSTKTIKGTDGFMAPEVYVTNTPDALTDYFSMAVLFYRLMIGGFPLDGKKTLNYLLRNNLSVQEAASTIYGKMALFAFDPHDNSNGIRHLVDPKNPELYAYQTRSWDRLPLDIQEGFIKTFCTGLKNGDRHKRATDKDWKDIFERLKSRLVRCRCGRVNFGDEHKKCECIFCNATLPRLTPQTHASPPPHPLPTPSQELTTVVFRARKDIEPTSLKIIAKRRNQLVGSAIYPGLNEGWMEIRYNPRLNKLAGFNKSSYTWIVSENGVSTTCAPGEKVVFNIGQVITVLRRQLQLKVTEIK